MTVYSSHLPCEFSQVLEWRKGRAGDEAGEEKLPKGVCASDASWLAHRETAGNRDAHSLARQTRLTTNAGVTWIVHCSRRKRKRERMGESGPQWHSPISSRTRGRAETWKDILPRVPPAATLDRLENAYTRGIYIALYENHTNFRMLHSNTGHYARKGPRGALLSDRLNICVCGRLWFVLPNIRNAQKFDVRWRIYTSYTCENKVYKIYIHM